MSSKLLVNTPSGKQEVIEIGSGGGYFDETLVVWDERKDGKMPDDIQIGKMKRINNTLVTSDEFIPEHVAVTEQESIKQQEIETVKEIKEYKTVKELSEQVNALTKLLTEKGLI
jgi:hypothetical protein